MTIAGRKCAVFCNFVAHYGPQLEYYAQRTILSPDEWTKVTSRAVLFSQLRLRRNFTTDQWTKLTVGPDNTRVGGVVWLGQPDAKEILAALPPGSREEISVRGIPFCFWKPDR
jgi:hypothetical protein